MKNYEKYKDLVIDSVKIDSFCDLAKMAYGDGCPADRKCSECMKRVSEWLDEEFKPQCKPRIDWSKVPVDTPVICTDRNGKKYNRYFSGYENGSVSTFSFGTTSWSADGFDSVWELHEVKLAREKDIKKYSIRKHISRR